MRGFCLLSVLCLDLGAGYECLHFVKNHWVLNFKIMLLLYVLHLKKNVFKNKFQISDILMERKDFNKDLIFELQSEEEVLLLQTDHSRQNETFLWYCHIAPFLSLLSVFLFYIKT